MSERSLEAEVNLLSAHDVAEQERAGSAESETKVVSVVKLDPLVLFQQIDEMRKEGVSDEVIRVAFEDFMMAYKGQSRQAVSVMKRHKDSVPMPTQEQINKMYEERYKGIIETAGPQAALILDAMQKSREVHAVLKRPTLKTYLYRAAYAILKRPLRFVIAFLKALQDGSN